MASASPQDNLPNWITVKSSPGINVYTVEPPPLNTASTNLQGQLLEIVYAALNDLGSLPDNWFDIQVDPDLVTKQISINMTIPIKASYPAGGQINIIPENTFVKRFSVSSGG